MECEVLWTRSDRGRRPANKRFQQARHLGLHSESQALQLKRRTLVMHADPDARESRGQGGDPPNFGHIAQAVHRRLKESLECLSSWASDEGQQTYVAYLLGDADRPGLVDELPIKREFMSIFYTPGAIVWNIKRADYNRSQITRIAGHPSYGSMTTRNITTARRLASL